MVTETPWSYVHLTPYDAWATVNRGPAQAWARGNAFHADRLLNATDLASELLALVSATDHEDALADFVRELNGFWAAVVLASDRLLAAVDRVRSIPLFFAERDGSILIGSDSSWLRGAAGEVDLDPESVEEFYILGYTTGSHTLCASVKQLEAGQRLSAHLSGGTLQVGVLDYGRWKHDRHWLGSLETLLDRGDEALAAAFGRLVERAGARQIVVPLSGGRDSRLVATMLRRLQYENVVCYSYGVESNAEATTSQQVAASLGYPWLFVPYTRDLWRSWYSSDQWRAYAEMAGGICVKPHLQDWPAVWRLRQDGLVSNNALYVPGHIVPLGAKSDVLTQVYSPGLPDAGAIINAIYHVHYALQRPRGYRRHPSPLIRERILAAMGDLDQYTDSADAYEAWELRQRESKFIINSIRVYEFWGYDWWLPLLDRELMDYWAGVPVAYRQGRKLHHQGVQRLYEATAGDRAVTSHVVVSRRKGKLAAFLRFSVLAPLYRLLIRIPWYWNEPRAWFGIITLWEYLRTMLEADTLGSPGFGVNTFLVRDHLRSLQPADGSAFGDSGAR